MLNVVLCIIIVVVVVVNSDNSLHNLAAVLVTDAEITVQVFAVVCFDANASGIID